MEYSASSDTSLLLFKLITMKELLDLVVEEAKNIRVHATQEEKDNLDLKTFRGSWVHNCIYGQMTGDCHNDRALELIGKCCTKVCAANRNSTLAYMPSKHEPNINGSPIGLSRFTYFSPIEIIVQDDIGEDSAYAGKLIDYIQGKTDTLTFENQ